MEPSVLKIVSQVAGVAGIALAVLFTLYREVIRKRVFSKLTKKQSFRLLVLILLLVWSVALAGIGTWIWINYIKADKPIENNSINGRHGLVGEWRVTTQGNLPETARRELEKIPDKDPTKPKKESANGMENDIEKIVIAFKGMTKAISEPGSLRLKLNEDKTYKLSEKKGIFQKSIFEKLGASGTWTFNREDRRLILIPTGENIGPSIKITHIENDLLIGEDLGRTFQFKRIK